MCTWAQMLGCGWIVAMVWEICGGGGSGRIRMSWSWWPWFLVRDRDIHLSHGGKERVSALSVLVNTSKINTPASYLWLVPPLALVSLAVI